MPLETGDWIEDLVTTNPLGVDPKAQGDDHLRLIKHVVQNQFPNLGAVQVLPSAQQLNDSIIREGTHTMEFYDALVGGNKSPTTADCVWFRIGNMVFLTANSSTISVAGMNGASVIYFTLPFAAVTRWGGAVAFQNANWGAGTQVVPRTESASARGTFLLCQNAGAIGTMTCTQASGSLFVPLTLQFSTNDALPALP
jgi:hypothetical protein